MSTLRTRRYKCICSGKSVQLKIIKVQLRTVRQLVSVDQLPRWQIAPKTIAPPIFLLLRKSASRRVGKPTKNNNKICTLHVSLAVKILEPTTMSKWLAHF